MLKAVLRSAGAVAAGAITAWWLRMFAHSKKPPAEGRWRELDLERRT